MTPSRFALLLIILSLCPAWADIHLPAIFSDHMVLLRSPQTPVWGTASPSEKIHIALGEISVETVAGPDGKWTARLDLSKSAPGPFTMAVNDISVSDVVVGETWLASGQSNMEWVLKDTNGAEAEIARSANPGLRYFGVVKSSLPAPSSDCQGQWLIAGPETSGGFSAVGYYFGKALQQKLKVPVGIINASWGGSPIEGWISADAIVADPRLRTGAENRWKVTAEYPAKKKAYAAAMAKWLQETQRNDHPAEAMSFAAENVDTSAWTRVKIPGQAAPACGAVWLRKSVDLPAWSPKEKFLLEIGDIQGFESIYWNGKLLKETTLETYPGKGYWRRVEVPFAVLKKGRNVVAIRIFAPAAPAQFLAPAENLKAANVSLSGDWFVKTEYELSPPKTPPPAPPANPYRAQDIASHLFNGMINPIVPYGIRGIIWYQGEANHTRAEQYVTTFPLLIENWRQKWAQPDLPFYHCQLANYTEKLAQPSESSRAELREAQLLSLKLPATGEAVLIDLGDSEDIHPRNKSEVGERLARLAFSHDYGLPVVASGPVFESAQIEGNTIRINFRHADGGLVAKSLSPTYSVKSVTGETAPLVTPSPASELQGFAICGSDHKWLWADARISGTTVIVSSPKIPNPVAVRYAWAENPTCNLYNGEGLPASPFRMDAFPRITTGKSY